jgi:hypothetical protein
LCNSLRSPLFLACVDTSDASPLSTAWSPCQSLVAPCPLLCTPSFGSAPTAPPWLGAADARMAPSLASCAALALSFALPRRFFFFFGAGCGSSETGSYLYQSIPTNPSPTFPFHQNAPLTCTAGKTICH